MDEADTSHTKRVGTNAELIIRDDLSCMDNLKVHVNEILDKLDNLDEKLQPERKPWWRRL